MLLWDTDWEKPPLKGEGNRRQAVEGFFREISVSATHCELPFQGSLCTNKPPLKREGDRR